MTSLAVIFILLLVVFLKQAHDQTKKAKDEVKEQLQALLEEKSLQLKQDPDDPLTLAVMVGENLLRFPVGGAALSTDGAGFVDKFFKDFAVKICSEPLRSKVDSLLIEGHTDTSGEKRPMGSETISCSVRNVRMPSSTAHLKAFKTTVLPTNVSSRSPRRAAAVREVPLPSTAPTIRTKAAAWKLKFESAPRNRSLKIS